MKKMSRALVSFGERWLLARGGRRTAMIIITCVVYVAFYVTAYLSGGFEPFFITLNFFLIVLASTSLGFPGAVAAATISGLLGGPFVTLFVSQGYGAPGVLWIVRLLFFELFGLLAGTVSMIFRDQVRGQRETSERFMQAQKLEAIGRLTGGIAHDFNNMLTAIGGYAHLMSIRATSDPELEPLAEELMDVVARSGSLTHQLLAISRKQVMEPRPVNIGESIRSLAKMLRRILGETIEIEISLSPTSWEVNVDPVQIDQVLMNLAVNSADAMPGGGKLVIDTENLTVDSVFLSQHPDLAPGDYVMVSVADTGEGINQKIAKQVFEPFFTTKPVGKGTGLGLSTAYGIVKQLGGDIWFASDPGRGTTFKICLPRAGSAAAPKPERRRASKPKAGARKATVLVAEDNNAVQSVIARLLEVEGYRVISVDDGRAAVKLLEKPDPGIDILVTDLVMPKMSGMEVIETVYRFKPSIGVIVISGYPREERDSMEITALADAFLEKPFTGARLLNTVDRLVG